LRISTDVFVLRVRMERVTTKRMLAGFLVVIILLAVLAWFVDWDSVIELIRGVKPWYLVLASMCLILGFLAYAERWYLLMEKRASYIPTFHAANAGNLVNTLLPLRPGDAARIVLLGGGQELSLALVTSSIVVERWFEQIMRLVAIGGAMLFGMGMNVSIISIAGVILMMIGVYMFMLLMINKRDTFLSVVPQWISRIPRISESSVREGLENLIDGFSGVSSPRYLMMLLVWSVITWGLFWGFHYLSFIALGVDSSDQTMLAITLGALAFVPPSAATLPGIYQISMVVPLALVGYDENLLTSYALVLNSLELFWILLLGIWGVLQSGYSIRSVLSRRSEA